MNATTRPVEIYARRLFAAHPPEDHPFCRALADGTLAPEVAKTAALEIRHVVACFPRLLAALLAQIPRYGERMLLVENLYCEHGKLDPAAVHEVTYRQFLEALGADMTSLEGTTPGLAATVYNRAMLDLCGRQSVPEALGALGVVEEIVARVSPLVGTYARGAAAAGGDNAHFGVHETLDLTHAAELYELAAPYFDDPTQREQVRRGMALGMHYHMTLYSMVLEQAQRRVTRGNAAARAA